VSVHAPRFRHRTRLAWGLSARARVAIAAGEPEQAERDAQDALARAAEVEAYLFVPDILECLAALAGQDDSHREAARLFGAASSIRQRMGAVRFKVWDAGYEASVAALRDAMGEKDFDSAWAEGAALSTEEAIAYAQCGRGQRKRPSSGWGSLTRPSETSSVSSAKDWPTTTLPQGFSSHPAPCRPTSPTSTPNSGSHRACNSPKKQHATPERRRDKSFRGLVASVARQVNCGSKTRHGSRSEDEHGHRSAQRR
jgi:hypothetical protein